MSIGASIWGAHWLGHASLWGALSVEMTQRWGYGRPDPAVDSRLGPARPGAERLALAALAGLMALQGAPLGSGLFHGFSAAPDHAGSAEQPGLPRELIGCGLPCLAAAHHGLAGPWLLPAPGVAGGIRLIAHARQSLATGMPGAICLAAGPAHRAAGGEVELGCAAALGLRAGRGQGSVLLGRVEAVRYAGPDDSGALADFLERLGRGAMDHGQGAVAAVAMNQPPDVKWQAAMDAAARRFAPRARRYMLPVDGAGQAGGLMLVMAAMSLATPRPESPRLTLACGRDGRAAALTVGAA